MNKQNAAVITSLLGRQTRTFLQQHSNQNKSVIIKMSTSASSEPDDVLFTEVGDKGIITLNRPKALNALNLSMVNKLYPTLKKWEKEKSLVIVKGAGDKAFCAGGDVKSVIQNGLKGDRKLGYNFFRTEYSTNGLIGTYKIPYVAFIDGIVMGGGVGLSVHGQYRIATETTLFAMPETQIGLFPDVGGSYFLPRLGGKLGLYLALTGYRLKGIDVLKAGISTHYCERSKWADIESDLLKCSNEKGINEALKKYCKSSKDSLGEFSLAPYLKQIDQCFSAPSIEEIMGRLEKDGSEWALDTLKTLNKMSPTSLKVTLRELDLGSKLSLHECLEMETRLAVNCLNNKDFYEGVRALLIDKDQNPKWNPPTLKDVSPALVESHFNKVADELEFKHKL